MSDLFRQDMPRGGHIEWSGPIVLTTTRPLRWVAIIVPLILGGAIFMIFFGRYTSTAHAQGTLVPAGGLIQLSAPLEGTVTAIAVRQGDQVRDAEPLITMSVNSSVSWELPDILPADDACARRP